MTNLRRVVLGTLASVAFVAALAGAPAAAVEGDEVLDGVYAVSAADPPALSVAISKDLHDDRSAESVILATSNAFPDVLAAGPLVGLLDAPLLLTSGAAPDDRLSAGVAAELARVATGTTRVFILGGHTAVSPGVEQAVRDTPGVVAVQRLEGRDRVETSIAIANYVVDRTSSKAVLVARGFGGSSPFADALAGGAYAARTVSPIILTTTESLSRPAHAWINGRKAGRTFHILGGPVAISTAAEAELRAVTPSVQRWSGETRYDTAVAIAKAPTLWDQSTPCGPATQFTVTTGNSFQAAALAAAYQSPVLLSNGPAAKVATDYLLTGTSCAVDIAVLGAGDISAGALARQLGEALERGPVTGSQQDPHPAGAAVTVANGLELTVLTGSRDATSTVVAAGAPNPGYGERYVTARLRVTNAGDDFVLLNRLHFFAIGESGDGAQEGPCGSLPERLPFVEMIPGETVEGNVCFVIDDEDAASVVLYYDPQDGVVLAPVHLALP